MRVQAGEFLIEMTNGNVRWTSYLTPSYFGKGKSRSHYYIKGIDPTVAEIRQGDEGGWDVLIFGTFIAHEDYKTDAQREVELAFDAEIEMAQRSTGWIR